MTAARATMQAGDTGPDTTGAVSTLQNNQEPAGLLSVDVFWDLKKGAALCRSNCRSIEVAVLYPASFSHSPRALRKGGVEVRGGGQEMLEYPTETMDVCAGQEQREISPIANHLSRVVSSTLSTTAFHFLSLPLELRLKIYNYLLPSRHHTIVTQIPHNGFFYNTSSVPAHSAQSFYPFGTKAPARQGANLTTYKVLSSNFRRSYPSESIHPAILGVSRQVKDEAEAVLYGNPATVWDFGVHLDACRAFWGDRSVSARRLVKSLRAAREIPCANDGAEAVDVKWAEFCTFLRRDITGLRTLDLTVWSSSGSAASFPVSTATISDPVEIVNDSDWEDMEPETKRKREDERKWSEWEWVHSLLQMDTLRTARITWWGFENLGVGGRNGEGSFDSWLAGRMVSDKLVRDRMVRDGVVVEGVVDLNGLGN